MRALRKRVPAVSTALSPTARFVFAAMMTPTPDAWTMLALAFPMIALDFGAVGVAALIDRRRHRDEPDWSGLADDEASTL